MKLLVWYGLIWEIYAGVWQCSDIYNDIWNTNTRNNKITINDTNPIGGWGSKYVQIYLLKGRTCCQIQVNAKTRKIYEKVHQAVSVDLWLTRGSNTSQQRQLHYQGKTSPVGRPLCLITFIAFVLWILKQYIRSSFTTRGEHTPPLYLAMKYKI